jgi:hypothetical protein
LSLLQRGLLGFFGVRSACALKIDSHDHSPLG